MPAIPDTADLRQRLFDMMNTDEVSDETFAALALDIFQFQFTHNLPYQNYCKALLKKPKHVTHWSNIPRVSTDSFKATQHPLTTCPDTEAERIFLTSGTTSDIKGRHIFPTLELYEKAALATWKRLDLPSPGTVVFLTPSAEHNPASSLSHMMGVLAEHYQDANIIWAISENGELDFQLLSQLAEETQPVAILGTAIVFLHLFENCSITLPLGSFAMETGGYKGTKRKIDKPDLYQLFEEKLNIPSDSVINEYSMTELSSQFYTHGISAAHRAPAWTRTRVIDPLTGEDSAEGEPGHLAIYDLANLYSVSALQTQDLAIAGENGSFTLLGRDPTALPRGCSRAADNTLR